ncbi:hypothetical protein QBC32DRAFT_251158 [Pseudoneurospora amorphoporcata]|uniref:Uncharacterized protein n=1 Tax=Pseudoneurospora amorphoporcata TaxID=241081 RepID=A0AAN6P2E7_9PEZI|nr:hypothetical protein QBC32DRAFT_251158 [Pseudoneurospora amorphoporcata]
MEGSWLLFETTDSIIEVLWDIALAFFVIRISFYYFLLTFLSSLILSYLAYAELLPITTPAHFLSFSPASEPVNNHILLTWTILLTITSAIWAHLVLRHYEVPRVAQFRLAICSMALAFMVSAEMVVAFALYEEGYGGWVWEEMKSVAGVAWGGWMVMYSAMPVLLMGLERRIEEKREGRVTLGHGFHRAGAGLHKLPTINEEKAMM